MESKPWAHISMVVAHFPLPWALISPAIEQPATHHWIHKGCVYIITITSCSVKTQPIRYFPVVAKGQENKKSKSEIQRWFILVWKRKVYYLDETLCLHSSVRMWKRLLSHIQRFKTLVDFRHVVIYRYLSRRQNKHPTARQTGISFNSSHVPGPY